MKKVLKKATETTKPSRKVHIFTTVLVFLLMLIMTGCSVISETFGKEYLIVDNFFEQLEADLRFTFYEYASIRDPTSEQESKMETMLDILAADIKIAKAGMKSRIKDMKEYMNALGYSGSTSDFIEKALLEQRQEIEKKLKEETDGQLILKHAEVQRGFFGSIWYFIRKHWLISLIILGIIGAIGEKSEELFSAILHRETGECDD